MRLHALQHVAFEEPAGIARWARARGHSLTTSHLYRGDPLPDPADFDMLVIMGGPMNIYQDELYPFLTAERELIKASIVGAKHLLGVCLGAQLIADALGSRVYAGSQKEIGWFPVQAVDAVTSPALDAARTVDAEANAQTLGRLIQTTLAELPAVLHWHGDTFDPPAQSQHLLQSAACSSQAFLYADRVLGLQFHLEMDQPAVERICQHCAGELEAAGPFVQTAQFILEEAPRLSARTLPALDQILDRFTQSL